MEETNTPAGNQSTRRRFLQWGTGILTFLCGLAVGIPLISSFVGPAFRTMKTNWIKVAEIGTLPEGLPISLNVADVQVDAYIQESVIRHLWAVKKSDAEISVFSPICPHLGCYYNWNPASGHFECPCHGSVYASDGTVLGGPAPRRLDTLPTKMENGVLYVEWKQFKSGTPEKIPV
ncbi:MAG: ubiquinol-cytochrome c reductase iron-sulfur subunit [Syntrophales bacterium]|jgi:menaquinol-cytochrome c reductase iron-sulfur subunit